MKILNKILVAKVLSLFALSAHSQVSFNETKCNVLYFFYGNNQVSFNSKLDTSKVKIVGEGCQITLQSEKTVLVLIPKLIEGVKLQVVEKSTNAVLCEKFFETKRLSEYKIFIDESMEKGDLTFTNGIISLRSPDESLTCNLPRIVDDIKSYEISIQGLGDILTGNGNVIGKKQIERINKFKSKNKIPSKLTVQLTTICVQGTRTVKTTRNFLY